MTEDEERRMIEVGLTMGTAIGVSYVSHQGQKYGPKDYFYHTNKVGNLALDIAKENPLTVTPGECLEAYVVGLLHDSLEDTKTTIGTIIDLFGTRIANYVSKVTLYPGDTREQYLNEILEEKVPTIVKYADNRINATHLEWIEDTGRRERMFHKYEDEHEILLDALINKHNVSVLS